MHTHWRVKVTTITALGEQQSQKVKVLKPAEKLHIVERALPFGFLQAPMVNNQGLHLFVGGNRMMCFYK